MEFLQNIEASALMNANRTLESWTRAYKMIAES